MYRHLLHAPIYHSILIVVFFLLIHIPDHIHHQQYARLQPYFRIHAGCLAAEFITQIQQFGRRIFIILSHSLFKSHINLIQPLLITPVIFIRSQAKQKIIRNSPDGCSLKYFIYVHILPILSLSRNISLLRIFRSCTDMQKLRPDMDIGHNIQRLRKASNMTQDQVIARLQLMGIEISKSTYAKIETNRMNIKVSELVALSKIFSADISEFFSGLV